MFLTIGSLQELLKKQKLQMAAVAQGQQAASTQQPQQVHATPAATGNPQIAAVAAPRAGAVLTGTTVTNLQVARLVSTQTRTPRTKPFTYIWVHNHYMSFHSDTCPSLRIHSNSGSNRPGDSDQTTSCSLSSCCGLLRRSHGPSCHCGRH